MCMGVCTSSSPYCHQSCPLIDALKQPCTHSQVRSFKVTATAFHGQVMTRFPGQVMTRAPSTVAAILSSTACTVLALSASSTLLSWGSGKQLKNTPKAYPLIPDNVPQIAGRPGHRTVTIPLWHSAFINRFSCLGLVSSPCSGILLTFPTMSLSHIGHF